MLKEVIDTVYFSIAWKIFLILVLSFILRYILNSYFYKMINRITRKGDKEKEKTRKTRLELLRKFLSILIFIVAIISILFMIPGFKSVAYSLVAGAGVAAIVLGFAAQESLSNILSGFSIAIYAPIRVGDKVKVFGERGEVEDLTLRHTVIKTWNNKRLIVPNSNMDNEEIINYSFKGEEILKTFEIGISYDSDIDKAKKIMLNNLKEHSEVIKDDEDKKPFVRMVECGDFSVNLRAYFWCEDVWDSWRINHELIESIKKKFDKKGIEIPFPYRTIVYKKDLDENGK